MTAKQNATTIIIIILIIMWNYRNVQRELRFYVQNILLYAPHPHPRPSPPPPPPIIICKYEVNIETAREELRTVVVKTALVLP